MSTCQMAGATHETPGLVVVRIGGVGDRRLCPTHLATLVALGVDFRVLDESVPRPLWRQRSLARDDSGLILGGTR